MKREPIDYAWKLFDDGSIGGLEWPPDCKTNPVLRATRVIAQAQADAVRPWRRCAWTCIAAAAAVLAAAFGGLV